MSATARAFRALRRPAPARRALRSGLLPAGLVVGAVLALSGCGRAGLAAQVDDHTITVDRLQSAVESLHAADRQAFGQVTINQVLSVLVYGPYAERAASQAGRGVSDDTVRTAVAAQAQQSGDKTAHPERLNDAALEALRGNIAFSELDDAAKAEVLTQLRKADIKISPRFGAFDPASGAITAATPNWITPAPAPSPSPSATG